MEIHEAPDELAAIAPEKAEGVKLRFFVGLEETVMAEVTGVSLRTVERHWAYDKAWLFDQIGKPPAPAKIISSTDGWRAKRG